MIKNMRDLGGIMAQNGKPVHYGCLIRSGNLHNAVPEDLKGVSEIIDFQTNLEEEKMPDTIPPGIMGMPIKNADAVKNAFLAKPEYLLAALKALDEKPFLFPDARLVRARLKQPICIVCSDRLISAP